MHKMILVFARRLIIVQTISESFIVLYLLLFKGTEQGIGISHAQREGETRTAVRFRHDNLLVLQLPDLLSQRVNHRVQEVRDQVWGKENMLLSSLVCGRNEGRITEIKSV